MISAAMENTFLISAVFSIRMVKGSLIQSCAYLEGFQSFSNKEFISDIIFPVGIL